MATDGERLLRRRLALEFAKRGGVIGEPLLEPLRGSNPQGADNPSQSGQPSVSDPNEPPELPDAGAENREFPAPTTDDAPGSGQAQTYEESTSAWSGTTIPYPLDSPSAAVSESRFDKAVRLARRVTL